MFGLSSTTTRSNISVELAIWQQQALSQSAASVSSLMGDVRPITASAKPFKVKWCKRVLSNFCESKQPISINLFWEGLEILLNLLSLLFSPWQSEGESIWRTVYRCSGTSGPCQVLKVVLFLISCLKSMTRLKH